MAPPVSSQFFLPKHVVLNGFVQPQESCSSSSFSHQNFRSGVHPTSGQTQMLLSFSTSFNSFLERKKCAACGCLCATASLCEVAGPLRRDVQAVGGQRQTNPKAKPITRRRMDRERRGAGSSLVSMETPYYKTIY